MAMEMVMDIVMEITINIIMEIIRNGQGNNHGEYTPHLWKGHQRVEKRSAADKLTWKYIYIEIYIF